MNKLSVTVYDNTGHRRGPKAVTPGGISIFNPLLSKSPQCTGFTQLTFLIWTFLVRRQHKTSRASSSHSVYVGKQALTFDAMTHTERLGVAFRYQIKHVPLLGLSHGTLRSHQQRYFTYG